MPPHPPAAPASAPRGLEGPSLTCQGEGNCGSWKERGSAEVTVWMGAQRKNLRDFMCVFGFRWTWSTLQWTEPDQCSSELKQINAPVSWSGSMDAPVNLLERLGTRFQYLQDVLLVHLVSYESLLFILDGLHDFKRQLDRDSTPRWWALAKNKICPDLFSRIHYSCLLFSNPKNGWWGSSSKGHWLKDNLLTLIPFTQHLIHRLGIALAVAKSCFVTRTCG